MIKVFVYIVLIGGLTFLIGIEYSLFSRIREEQKQAISQIQVLNNLLRDLRTKEGQLKFIVDTSKKLNIEKLSKGEALERIVEFVNQLRAEGIVGSEPFSFREEKGYWLLEGSLELSIEDLNKVGEILDRFRRLKSPIVSLKELEIDYEKGSVKVGISIVQPFLEAEYGS